MILRFPNLPFVKVKSNSRQEIYSRRAHSHNEVSLGYIHSGRTTITVQGQKYNLSEGDLVLIPSKTVHLCVPEDLSCYRFQMIYLDADWLTRHFSLPPDSFKTLAIPVTRALKEVFTMFHQNREIEKLNQDNLITPLNEILEKYNLQNVKTHSAEAEIEKVHQMIREMPQISLSVDYLASLSGLNKYSFIRQYSGRYGLTPHADIINMRIQRAVLLLESEMPMAEIALYCGFSDQSHFIHQFKLYCGLRPLEYREGIRETQALPSDLSV